MAEYSYEQLHKMTVGELREIAAGIEDERLQGHSQLHKEQLLPILCQVLGIEAHAHHVVVGIDKAPINQEIRSLKAKYPDIQGIQSASPDGRWFATGLHLYNAENCEVKEELPLASRLWVFSADSKTLYLYDPWNGYVVPMKIE